MDRMDELISDIKHLITDINEVRITLAENTITLNQNTSDVAHHIKRTDILERRVDKVELPFKSAKWVAAFVIGFASFVGAIYGLIQLFGIEFTK